MSSFEFGIVPVAYAGDDALVGPGWFQGLNKIESFVVSILASPLAGGLAVAEAVADRSLVVDRVLSFAEAAEDRERRAGTDVRSLIERSDLLRWRGLGLGHAEDLVDAAELARDAARTAERSDPRLEADALHRVSLALQEQVHQRMDLQRLALTLAAAARSRDAAIRLARLGPDPDWAKLLWLSLPLSTVSVTIAEVHASPYNRATARDALAYTKALAERAGVDLSRRDRPDGNPSELTLGIDQLLLESRFAGLFSEEDPAALDRALHLSERAYRIARDIQYLEGIPPAALLYAQQAKLHGSRTGTLAPSAVRTMLGLGLLTAWPFSPECMRLLGTWGQVLWSDTSGQASGVPLAVSVMCEFCSEILIDRDPYLGLEVAARSAVLATEQHEGALVAQSAWWQALRAHRQMIRQSGTEAVRLISVHIAMGLYSRAAASHAAGGDGVAAAEIAEMGRSVSREAVLAAGAESLEQLRAEGSSAVADDYLNTLGREREAFEAFDAWEQGRDFDAPPDHAEAERKVQQLLDVILERRAAEDAVRTALRDEEFPGPLTFSDIRGGADDASLVYIIAGQHSGYLVIIRDPSVAAPEVVALPLLTEAELSVRSHRFVERYERWDAKSEGLQTWPVELDDAGRWLWDAVAGPLLEAVGDGFVRVVAMGGLMAMPLQAAWTLDDEGRRVWLIDHVTLSYLPNAAGRLRAARRPSTGRPTALLIDDPREDLPDALGEADGLRRRFGADLVELRGATATAAAVRNGLATHNLVHLSAHGYVDRERPQSSAVVLADRPLEVEDLRDDRFDNLQLLVLSSCESALAGGPLQDEWVGFPGLLYGVAAGAVIGTHWAVDQQATARLFTAFYERLPQVGKPRASAEALREAQRTLRDSDPRYAHPVWWAGFLHVG